VGEREAGEAEPERRVATHVEDLHKLVKVADLLGLVALVDAGELRRRANLVEDQPTGPACGQCSGIRAAAELGDCHRLAEPTYPRKVTNRTA